LTTTNRPRRLPARLEQLRSWVQPRHVQIQWGLSAVVIWAVVFWRLGYLSLLDPDEAHYGQLTREMMRARQWMVPLLDGMPFIDKPVLYHWLQAGAEQIFGETEFALRLPSACAALAIFWTVRWTGRRLFDPTVGRTAALMFATTPLTFALASIGVFDMVYTAFLFGAVAALLVSQRTDRRQFEWVGWLLLACAVMVKGPIALLLVLMFGAVLWVIPSTRALVRPLHWAAGPLLVVLLAAPWFVYMASVYRGQFVRDYLLAGNLWYFTRPVAFSTRASDPLFYARTYLGACFPWSVLAIGVAIERLRVRRETGLEEQAMWIWTGLVLVFFSIAGFKLDTYVFPAVPATCIIVAIGLARVEAPARRLVVLACWLVVIALVGGGAVLAGTMFRIDLGLTPVAALIPAALTIGGLAAGIRLRSIGPSAITSTLVATLVATYAVVVVEGFPVLERSRPTAPIGRWVDRHAPPGDPVGVYGLDDWRASIRFYTRRHVVVLHDGSEISDFFSQHPDSFVIMLRADAAGFRANGVGLRRVGGRRAIVGRSGKFIRRQRWGRIVVTASAPDLARADTDPDVELPDR
jgi:4-amino-4-deoxy-L-arabinose transferase-like glycosyltransferase